MDTKATLDRFWAKVRKTDGCWVWMAALDRRGYGAFGIMNHKLVKAHRFSWMIHNGPIPAGLCVLHHCDNPSCVNPDHLFIGTYADNVRDMIEKGRQLQGEERWSAKLTDAKVLLARHLHNHEGYTVTSLAMAMGVVHQTMSKAISGHTWKHVGKEG